MTLAQSTAAIPVVIPAIKTKIAPNFVQMNPLIAVEA